MKTKEMKSIKEAWEKQKKEKSKVDIVQKMMVVKKSPFYEIVPSFLLQLMRKGELTVAKDEGNTEGGETTKAAANMNDGSETRSKLFASMAKKKEGGIVGRTFRLRAVGGLTMDSNPISREQFLMVAEKSNPQTILNNHLVLIGGIGSEYLSKLDVFDLSKIEVTRHP